MKNHEFARCAGGGCPQKTSCIRFLPGDHAGVLLFSYPPFDPDTAQCDFFSSSLENLLLETKKKGTEKWQ